MTHTSAVILIALLSGAATAPSVAAETSSRSSTLALFVAENETAERSLVRRLIKSGPTDPTVRKDSQHLRLLHIDLASLGYDDRPLAALDASDDDKIAVQVLLNRAGLDEVKPWNILAGRTLTFRRAVE